MLIELGPRMIGKCQLSRQNCTAKNFNIVKKVFMAKNGQTAWVCHTCMKEKMKEDHLKYERTRDKFVNSVNTKSS